MHWNVEAGDLSAAHLVALHGVQVIPLATFLLGGSGLGFRRQLAVLVAFSAGQVMFGAILLRLAITRVLPLDFAS